MYHAWDSGLIVVVTCLLFLHGVRLLRVPAQVSPASSSESPTGSKVETQISIYMVKLPPLCFPHGSNSSEAFEMKAFSQNHALI